MRKLRVFASISITAVAKGMNAATRYVASMTTQPIWSNTHLLKRDLVTAVRELKASEGTGVTVLGSGSVATSWSPVRRSGRAHGMARESATGADAAIGMRRQCGARFCANQASMRDHASVAEARS